MLKRKQELQLQRQQHQQAQQESQPQAPLQPQGQKTPAAEATRLRALLQQELGLQVLPSALPWLCQAGCHVFSLVASTASFGHVSSTKMCTSVGMLASQARVAKGQLTLNDGGARISRRVAALRQALRWEHLPIKKAAHSTPACLHSGLLAMAWCRLVLHARVWVTWVYMRTDTVGLRHRALGRSDLADSSTAAAVSPAKPAAVPAPRRQPDPDRVYSYHNAAGKLQVRPGIAKLPAMPVSNLHLMPMPVLGQDACGTGFQ
jgi:hypothetical protein